jgi:flavin-dependent dehydrogenase
MDNNFDAIIVGAGPAGGQCAKELAEKGYKTLLVERYKSFEGNNFSTAGMTLTPLKEFNIPEEIVGAYWKDITIQCSNSEYSWKGEQKKGAVLDFGKLKQYLADESEKSGGEVLTGYRYIAKEYEGDLVIARFKEITSGKEVQFKAKLLVDATGPLRKVMFDAKEEQPDMVCASGIEYLIEVEQEVYDKYKELMVFFLGEKWALKGYSWILPMENRILKVGSGKMHIQLKDEEITSQTVKKLTKKIIDEYIKADNYKLLDVHGGTLRYSPSIQDVFYNKKVVAVGDAVSTVNPLGGEGIRYAMQNASLAVKYIDTYLKTGNANFKSYRRKWRNRNIVKWQVSEVVGRKVYGKYDDAKIEKRMSQFHQNSTIDGLIDVIFRFEFRGLVLRFIREKVLMFKSKIINK